MTVGAYAIVANVALPDSCLRTGARVVIHGIPGNPERVRVRGISRGGRAVTKYTRTAGLRDIRAAWEHAPPFGCSFASKDEAERCITERFGPFPT